MRTLTASLNDTSLKLSTISRENYLSGLKSDDRKKLAVTGSLKVFEPKFGKVITLHYK